MMNVLMPCAGLYKRFPAGTPKYLQCMIDLRPMFAWALDSVRAFPGGIRPYFAIRKENDDIWNAASIIKKLEPAAEVMILDHQTNGPAHTVYEMIKYFGICGAFIVKDSDCSLSVSEWYPNECGLYLGWRETAIGDRGTKCWVEVKNGFVSTISEKARPSDWYCHGCYQFAQASDFVYAYERYRSGTEIFCSHIISLMLETGIPFRAIECHDLNDWGTWEKYVTWRQRHKALFIDIDGVITTAGAPYGNDSWMNAEVIKGVREKLQALKRQGCAIYLVTSRPESEAILTEEILSAGGVTWDRIIYEIQLGPRIMVNDYADSNPYPSVMAINTKRNSGSWLDKI